MGCNSPACHLRNSQPISPRAMKLFGQRLFIFFFAFSFSIFADELLPPGFRPRPLGVHVLTDAKVFVKPGEVLDSATIIIRDGFIENVGTNVALPADARVWDAKGMTIYAGFIDPYLVLSASNAPVSTTESEPVSGVSFTSPGIKFFGTPGSQTDMGEPGPGNEVAGVTPELRTVRDYSPKEKTLAPLREAGFTTAVIAPGKGII